MLVSLNIDKDYLTNLKKDMEDPSKFDLSRVDDLSESIAKEFMELVSKVKGLKMEDIHNNLKEVHTGIYETSLEISVIADIAKINFSEYYHFGVKDEYGMADNYEQILDFYPELNDPNKKYIVVCEWLYRDSDNPGSGFRYHKNGPYIGNLNPKHAYFNDDTHIEKLLLYHVIEVLEENVHIDDYTDNFFELSRIV